MIGVTSRANGKPPLTKQPIGAVAMADKQIHPDPSVCKRCTKCGGTKPLSQYNLCRGKPRGHCKVCHSRSVVAWQRANPEKARAKHERWRDAHFPDRQRGGVKAAPPEVRKERKIAANRKWLSQNGQRMSEIRRAWDKANPDRIREKTRRYQAAKRKAVPRWASVEKMAALYAEAIRLSKETGIPHEVDHIIPLKSDIVCGLHCEANLQVLPLAENRSKGNKIIHV